MTTAACSAIRLERGLGVAGVMGVCWFAASLLALQIGGGELDWTRHYVSDFATGSRGWLFRLGVLGHAIGNAALAVGLYRCLRDTASGSWASGLFLLATIGLALTGLIAADPPGTSASAAGAVHRAAASVSFAVELAALFLWSVAFAARPGWRGAAGLSFALSAVAAATTAMLVLAIGLDWRPGLAERAAVAAFMVWEFWAGLALARGRIAGHA